MELPEVLPGGRQPGNPLATVGNFSMFETSGVDTAVA